MRLSPAPLIALLALSLAGCAAGAEEASPADTSAPTPDTVAVSGVLSTPAGPADPELLCVAAEPYTDIAGGNEIVLTDAEGADVATGEILAGVPSTTAGQCSFKFTINGVPDEEGTYGLRAGSAIPEDVTIEGADFGRYLSVPLGQ